MMLYVTHAWHEKPDDITLLSIINSNLGAEHLLRQHSKHNMFESLTDISVSLKLK